jgi:hypothetical protein
VFEPHLCAKLYHWTLPAMMTTLLQSVLPGIRDVRSPLVAGLLWLLVAWLVFAGSIPSRSEATGFVKQVYDVSSSVGQGYTLGAVGGLAYVLGIVGVHAADAIRDLVVWAMARWATAVAWIRWQRVARSKVAELSTKIEAAETALHAAKGSTQEPNAALTVRHLREQEEKLRPHAVWFQKCIRRTPAAARALGLGDPHFDHRYYNFAREILEDAWAKGVDDELRRRDLDVSIRDTDRRGDYFIDRLMGHDIGDSPLDALRAVDQQLYSEFDRERAERELRIAVMPPVIAISTLAGLNVSVWAWAIVGLAGWTFVHASLRHATESSRVLNHIVLKRLPLPSLAAAERSGREAVRDFLAKENKSKRPAAKASTE